MRENQVRQQQPILFTEVNLYEKETMSDSRHPILFTEVNLYEKETM